MTMEQPTGQRTERSTALNAITPLGACAASLAGESGIEVHAEGLFRRPSIQSNAQSRRGSYGGGGRRHSQQAAQSTTDTLQRVSLTLHNDMAEQVEEDDDGFHRKEMVEFGSPSAEELSMPALSPHGDGATRGFNYSQHAWMGNSPRNGKKGQRIYTINREVDFVQGSWNRAGPSSAKAKAPPAPIGMVESKSSPYRASVSTTSIAALVGGSQQAIIQSPSIKSSASNSHIDRQSTLLPSPSPRLFHSKTAPPQTSTAEPIASVPHSSPRETPTLGQRPRLDNHFTPSWTLRYAELIGLAAEEPSFEKTPKTKSVQPIPAAPAAPQQSSKETGPVTDSIYLAKGLNKRLPKLKGKNKPSRLKARRIGITSAHPQSKMQVTIAVKKSWKERPGHMRRLNKALEEIVGKGQVLKVENKEIEDNRLHALAECTGIHEDEITNLFDGFHRYDIDDSGFLDRNEVRQVLFDLGLQPRSQEEKVEVNEVLCDLDMEGLSQYSFEQYLTLVKCVRERFRQTQLGECMVMFEEADSDGNKVLSLPEVMKMLDIRLGLSARSDDERHELQALFNQCDADSDSEVNFEEFQTFVQLARAKLMTLRRKQELTIAKAFQLNSDLINEFRMDLPILWEVFNRYGLEEKSRMTREDLMSLLIDIGLAPWRPQPADEKMEIVQEVMNLISQHWNEFPHVLNIMKMIRSKYKAANQKDLHDRFLVQDRFGYGELEMSEIYPILETFRMLPRTREEQLSIKSVIERLDTDGSGTFCFHEFEDFFQRLTEHVQYVQREQERAKVMAMGYNETQLQNLRNSFMSMNPTPQGRIGQIGVVSAINQARDTIFTECHVDEGRVRDITRVAQQYPDHMIDFLEFTSTIKQVMARRADNHMDEEHLSGEP